MPCTPEQFHDLVELHKFYFEILLTSASFLLGVVGGVVAYVAKAHMPPPRVRLSLAVPALLSTSAFVGYSGGYLKLRDLESWILSCKATLGFGWAPHAEVLGHLSLLFAAVSALVSIGLLAILAKPHWLLGSPGESSFEA